MCTNYILKQSIIYLHHGPELHRTRWPIGVSCVTALRHTPIYRVVSAPHALV